jgi:hypothetical protein
MALLLWSGDEQRLEELSDRAKRILPFELRASGAKHPSAVVCPGGSGREESALPSAGGTLHDDRAARAQGGFLDGRADRLQLRIGLIRQLHDLTSRRR